MREFRNVKKDKTLVWKIWQDKDTYYTESGQLNGKMQQFSDTPGDKGVAGTKAYVDPIKNCEFNIQREIRKKAEHGYVEYKEGELISKTITSLRFDEFLPKNFCGSKPQTSIEEKKLKKIHDSGKARYTRKRDGQNHIAVLHTWGWEIYTRRMDVATERFPKHIESLSALDFGVGTILTGEMICSDANGNDNFKNISRICRSDPPEARILINSGECPEPIFYIFDVLFYNGSPMSSKTYDERRALYKSVSLDTIKPIETYDVTPDTWESIAKKNSWEGFVIVDGSAAPGDKFFSYDGDAKRPNCCFKLKPVHHEDVIVFAGVIGSGKRQNGIGAVFVKQIHPETNKIFNCGKVGSGFSEEALADMEKLFKDNNIPLLEKDKDIDKLDMDSMNGLVIELEYSERQPGTNKFRFPVFMRVRNDKSPKECFAQRLAAEEE
jgi:DNA ligase-1